MTRVGRIFADLTRVNPLDRRSIAFYNGEFLRRREKEIEIIMKPPVNRRIKIFALDDNKVKLAKKLMGAKSDAETIEIALTELINTREEDNELWKATDRLIKSGIDVRDVFGRLNGQ